MPIRAMGPTYAGGEESLLHNASGYRMTFLPDVNNHALQEQGDNPVFYWVPNIIRLARKNGPDDGDYLFNLIRFAGSQSSEGMVGVEEDREVAGGIVTFTVTSAPPDDVLAELQQQIIDRFSGDTDYFWGIRTRIEPIFRPAIVRSNNVSVSNIAPSAEGTIPVSPPVDPALPAPRGAPKLSMVGSPRTLLEPPSTVRQFETRGSGNLDPWFWQMQGEGAGSISPSGTNAYSALVGAYPAAIMWEAFHGTSSPIVVNSALQLLAWAPVVDLTISGKWERVFNHFSAAAQGRYYWASADIKAEFNNMRMEGVIDVDLSIDPTIPNGEEILRNIEKESSLVYEKFMEEARKVIFEPPQPEVEAAEASSGSFWQPYNLGFALNYRRDSTTLDLYYHKSTQLAYLQPHVISSSLTGMFEEMAADPDAEGKYFRTVYLDDWPKKLARIVKPVVNWTNKAVAFVSAQIGYPSTNGDIRWEGRVFQEQAPDGDRWDYSQAQKEESDVSNKPEGWTADKTFVKRSIHMSEPSNPLDDPFNIVEIDQNQIDLDSGENGSLINNIALEVRADTAGRLSVGPIDIAVVLENTEKVEVTFEATDGNGGSMGRQPVKFSWDGTDQQEDRYWTIYTGDPDFRAFYRYKVRVLVKGSIFEPGMEWEGPWVETSGNGPLTISIPMRGEEGVNVVRSQPREFLSLEDFAERRARDLPEPMVAGSNGVRGTESSSDHSASVSGWPISREANGARAHGY